MRETEAIIERVWQVSPAYQRLELTVEPAVAALQAGQSVLALLSNAGWEPYLREQWQPVELTDRRLVVERSMLQYYQPRQTVSLIGPIGSGLPWIPTTHRNLLLIAQDAPPTALLMLAQQAIRANASVALVLTGHAATTYPMPALPSAIEVIHGQAEGAWTNQNDTISWADQIYVVADEGNWQEAFAQVMYAIKHVRLKVPIGFVYGVFSLPQPCGTGACMACMVRGKINNYLACQEGPAFDLTEILLP